MRPSELLSNGIFRVLLAIYSVGALALLGGAWLAARGRFRVFAKVEWITLALTWTLHLAGVFVLWQQRRGFDWYAPSAPDLLLLLPGALGLFAIYAAIRDRASGMGFGNFILSALSLFFVARFFRSPWETLTDTPSGVHWELVSPLFKNPWFWAHSWAAVIGCGLLLSGWAAALGAWFQRVCGMESGRGLSAGLRRWNERAAQGGAWVLALSLIAGGIGSYQGWGRYWHWESRETALLGALLMHWAVIFWRTPPLGSGGLTHAWADSRTFRRIALAELLLPGIGAGFVFHFLLSNPLPSIFWSS